MQVNINQDSTFIEVIISGRVDATTTAILDTKINECVSEASLPILVNFADVEYISSAGLRSILKLGKACISKKLEVRLFAMQKAVFEVFKISGFSSIIKILDTKEDALSSLK